MIFSDETTIRLDTVKRLVWDLAEKKTNCHAFDQGCFSSQGFGHIICFEQNFNAEFMCDIYKRGLLPTAGKQFGLDWTIW